VKVSELVDTEFVITRIDERTGDWGEYLAVVVEVEGKPFFFFSSHQVLVQKLRRCVDNLPLVGTITVRESKEGGRTYFDIG